jgi:Kef-type K+ transport system membrane component KefB
VSLTTPDLAHVLTVLTLLLIVAHVGGQAFRSLRQPPVIGEIVGGLLLGPTLLGAVAPGLMHALFGPGVVKNTLGVMYNLGLLALMFVVGGEIALVKPAANERRTVACVTATGLLLPLAGGLALGLALDTTALAGAHGTPTTVALVFALATAVTSVPVISRILIDLGIINTPFARSVMAVAVLEDIALYGVLAVVLGLAQARSGHAYGLWGAIGVTSTGASIAYYVLTTLVFFAVFLARGTAVFRALAASRLNLLGRQNPIAFRLSFLLGLALLCVALGINPIFGALLAGASVARSDAETPAGEEASRARVSLARFSFAFFIPLYFAIVGLSLDLSHQLDPVFFLWFLGFACTLKATSAWLGARIAGESRASSTNLAVALNARGGPGIVLATVTLNAGIISTEFFTSLVVLSIVTSEIAGAWLDWRFVRSAHSTGRAAPELAAANNPRG